MLRFIDHACTSNVWPVDRDGDTIYIALRPISAGERLSVNYYGFHWDITGANGYKEKNNQCDCELCVPHEQRTHAIESLATLPEYQFISSQKSDLDKQTMDGKTFYTLKKMCCNILRKFGSNSWGPQLKLVFETYAQLLTIEFNGTLTASKTCDNNNDA